jgi:ABC-type sugar transport system permease subunit
MYPVQFTAQWVERHSRLSTFFRFLLAIPAEIVAFFYLLAASFAVFFAWFAMVFTGRYPEGLYNFACGALRNITRVNGYLYYLTDQYPPFNGKPDDTYPVALTFAPPLEQYSRAKAFFRVILYIPVLFMTYVYSIMLSFVVFAAWVVIIITGKLPKGLQDIIELGVRYTIRGHAYYWLITETYPPLSDPATETPSYPPPAPVV